MRGISSVADATLFLLLVGGAITTLVGGTGAMFSASEQPTPSGNPAAEDATLLATTTATLNYSMAPAASSTEGCVSFDPAEGPGFRRTAHGTLASLLADAALGNASIAGEELSQVGDKFERTLSSAVRDRVGRRGVRMSVEASWEPYPAAPIGGAIHIGDRPPRDADVHAATLETQSDVPASRERAQQAAREDGYRGVAGVVADAVVRGLFPPRETRHALRGEYPVDALTTQRYCRAASILDARSPVIADGNVTESNDHLRTALARRFGDHLATQFDSPGAAARAVETDTVELTVRTWSP